MTRRFLPGLFIALGVLALGLVVAFTVGRYPVTLDELADVLLSRVTGRPSTAPAAVENVVLLVRGPRVLAAVMVWAALAVAGTAFQGLFRNPLVSPDILGASSGAALGAVLGIFLARRIGIGLCLCRRAGRVAAVYVIGSLLRSRAIDPCPGAPPGSWSGHCSRRIRLVKYLADPYNRCRR
jgi:iron complex transport system permease protein